MIGVGVHLLMAQSVSTEWDSLLIFGPEPPWSNTETIEISPDISWLFEVTPEYTSKTSMAIQEWHRDHQKTDVGLRLTATANRHFGQGFNQEVDNFDQYRMSLGIEWNLYEKGWFYNRTQSLIHENQAQILRLMQTEEEAQSAYGTQYNAIIYLFGKEKIDYLKSFSAQFEYGARFYQQLYLQHFMPYHQVLELKKRIEKMDFVIHDYQAFNKEFEKTYGERWLAMASEKLGPMNLSIKHLLENDPVEEKQLLVRDLENDNIKLRNRTKSDIRIGMYARRNFTRGQAPGINGDYNTLGVKLSVPLRSLYSYHKNLSELEIEENNQRHQLSFQEKKKELMVAYYEYEYRLQQYLDLHYEKLKLAERLRQQTVQTQLDSSRTSVIKTFTLFQEFVDVGYEMIGLRQLLYLGLLQIQHKLPDYSISDYCKPLRFKNDRKLKGQRVFQVSAEDIQALGIDFIANYLINNEARQLQSNGLSLSEIQRLENRGFEFIKSHPDQTLLIVVNDFKSRLDIEAYIDKQAETYTTVLFDSISHMVALEMKILNGI